MKWMGSLDIAQGVRDFKLAPWDALTDHASPFHEHAFLAGLEETGCVGAGTGWDPVTLCARDSEGALKAALPLYIKSHSMGEFVYDWSFADAASRAGLPYYPKMVGTSPFSPIAGPRVLLDPALAGNTENRARLVRQLLQRAIAEAQSRGCQSIHLLFCTDEEAAIARDLGFFTRLAIQLHWENNEYGDFDDFLSRFRSKRRKDIRRERRRLTESGVDIKTLRGAQMEEPFQPSHVEAAFRFYKSTVARFGHGNQYLNRDFFEALFRDMPHRIALTLAHKDGALIAGALSLEKSGRRYGRYWGADASVPFLHFGVCAYAPIEDAIKHGLQAFEAGAGAHAHKYERGFCPRITQSVHLYFHDDFHHALDVYCQREAEHIRREASALARGVFIR